MTLWALLVLGCGEARTEATEATTDGGSFEVAWASDPDPVPFNEPFGLTLSLTALEGSLDGVDLGVAASMPDHGHAMTVAPVVEGEAAAWTADGLLFHMEGWWQIDVTVQRDGTGEIATFYVDCCEA